MTSKHYLVKRDRGITFWRDFPTRDMILPSAEIVNDRQIVLSGLDSIRRFYIYLDSEKKQFCNSSLRKCTNHLICYLDLIILQKFDPILLQALFRYTFLIKEIYPLKCSMSKRSYFFRINISFLLSSRIFIHFLSEACTHWDFRLKCSTTQGFPVYACFGYKFVHFNCKASTKISCINILTLNFEFLIFSHFLRVQPACQQSVMMDVLAGVASIALSL